MEGTWDKRRTPINCTTCVKSLNATNTSLMLSTIVLIPRTEQRQNGLSNRDNTDILDPRFMVMIVCSANPCNNRPNIKLRDSLGSEKKSTENPTSSAEELSWFHSSPGR